MPSERYPRTDTLTTHLPTPKGWAAELVSSYSKQFQWLESNPGPPTSQPYALNIWPHCDIYPFTQGHCKLCFHKMIKKSKKCTGCPKQKSCIWSTKDKKPLFQFLKYILFWINKALLTLFGQGFLPVWKDLRGGQNAPPPVMHEADDAYSIWSTWSCYWLDQFLTLALDAWILSKFSTLYWICLLLVFLILVGVELPLCL